MDPLSLEDCPGVAIGGSQSNQISVQAGSGCAWCNMHCCPAERAAACR